MEREGGGEEADIDVDDERSGASQDENGGEDSDGDGERRSNHDDDGSADDESIDDRYNFRYGGRLFARASEMARCMEELSHEHYGTTSLTYREKVTNSYRWPIHTYQQLAHSREMHYFVRMAYQPSPDEDPCVLEGFWEFDESWGGSESSISQIPLRLRDDAANDKTRGLFNKLFGSCFVPNDDGHIESHRFDDIGLHMCLTILELCPDSHNRHTFDFVINLVSSSKGLWGLASENGQQYGYLNFERTSPDFSKTEVEDDGKKMSVQFSLENGPDFSLAVMLYDNDCYGE